MFSQASIVDYTREQMSLVLQALLDKYNEDHHLLGVYSLSLLPALTPGPLTRIVLFVLIFMF